MKSWIRRNLPSYGAYFIAWTVGGLLYFSEDVARRLYRNDPTPLGDVFASWMIGMYIWAAFTPGIVAIGRRWPIERDNWPWRASLHVLFAAIASVLELELEAVIYVQLGILPNLLKPPIQNVFRILLVYGFFENLIRYGIVLTIQAVVRYYQKSQAGEREALRLELRASELEAQLARAQLRGLKMQLQPHFLFNTLGAIVVLVRQERGSQAEEMLERLSDLLRCVLEDVEAQEVPLRRELEYLRLYLSIEEVRFADRLAVEISAGGAILDAFVPHMVLQPLVENAIRHGVGRSAAPVKVGIQATRVNGSLELKVRDDGPGFPPSGQEGKGIGLTNTRERLRQLYGDAAELIVDPGEKGVTVTLILPYHEEAYAIDGTHRG